MARFAVALLLLAPLAAAQGGVRKTADWKAELVNVLGKDTVARLPAWRLKVASDRYALFLEAPPERQERIRRRGLSRWLLDPPRGPGKLPEPLREAVEQLPEKVRPMAARLAFTRMRQLQLDRVLRRIPTIEERWEVFNVRFPEPYDPKKAKRGHELLKKHLVESVAKEVATKLAGRELDPEQRKRLTARYVRRKVEAEERRVIDKVRSELFRFKGSSLREWRRYFETKGFHLVERIRFATPRQRELIRYAFRPHECPLLDLDFLGPRPENRLERKEWDRDFVALARIELLFEAQFPREVVLYLAGTGSPADFFRAVQRIRTPRPQPYKPGDPPRKKKR